MNANFATSMLVFMLSVSLLLSFVIMLEFCCLISFSLIAILHMGMSFILPCSGMLGELLFSSIPRHLLLRHSSFAKTASCFVSLL